MQFCKGIINPILVTCVIFTAIPEGFCQNPSISCKLLKIISEDSELYTLFGETDEKSNYRLIEDSLGRITKQVVSKESQLKGVVTEVKIDLIDTFKFFQMKCDTGLVGNRIEIIETFPSFKQWPTNLFCLSGIGIENNYLLLAVKQLSSGIYFVYYFSIHGSDIKLSKKKKGLT
jgi:hypothetical protein